MSFAEWLGRVIMLVLAGMITLSIIGAIAAIPSGSNLPQQIGVARPLPTERRSQAEPAPAQTAPEPRQDGVPRAGAEQPATATIVPEPPAPVDPAEWLEVIAYALLALAGLGVAAILLLWRSLHQRRRIAEALEALSAAPPASSLRPSPASMRGS
jgi:hypothetical protein